MTEQEFDQQVWRRFDTVTLDTGIETTIMYVCFSSRSVRIYVRNSPPEWVGFERIASHKSRFGGTPDDSSIIEELHNKIMNLNDELERLREKNKELKEQVQKNYAGALLTQINIIGSNLQEKHKKMERIEASLLAIEEIIEKVNPHP